MINNAGILFKEEEDRANCFDKHFKTNLFGTVKFTEKMLPLIKEKGKIIFVGSRLGLYENISKEDLLKRFQD